MEIAHISCTGIVYVCVHVCVCACVAVCAHIYMSVCMRASVCTRVCGVCMRTCVCTCTCVCVHASVCARVRVRYLPQLQLCVEAAADSGDQPAQVAVVDSESERRREGKTPPSVTPLLHILGRSVRLFSPGGPLLRLRNISGCRFS